MAALDRIRTRGFRHWYERQLIECHAWLVSCFLGIIASASGIELVGAAPAAARLSGIALALGGALLTLFSWQRYRAMLLIAERLGERAVCPECGTYGRFKVVASGPTPLPDGADPDIDELGDRIWLRARCRQCEREWLL